MINNKFSFFIFDLDGVIFDSIKNMEISWDETCKKFNINKKFNQYYSKIGLPFNKILISLNIYPKKQIFECYKKSSLKNINLIKKYKGTDKMINILKKKKIKFSIVTSKDFRRSSFLLKKHKIYPNSIHCHSKGVRGKPWPDLINRCLRINNIKPEEACYVGDTEHDYLAAKNANIKFIFANYGYGKFKKKYKYNISKITDIKKFLNFNKI